MFNVEFAKTPNAGRHSISPGSMDRKMSPFRFFGPKLFRARKSARGILGAIVGSQLF